ncbi:MAG: hypothetical protein NT166_26790 [Candidatus Aminicenantes bacterium]|nr:hypothetical protein [Candidatus Aminicenantes bacterium]
MNLYYLVRGEGDMFGVQLPTPSLGGKQVSDPIESILELPWHLERSALMRYNILFARKGTIGRGISLLVTLGMRI